MPEHEPEGAPSHPNESRPRRGSFARGLLIALPLAVILWAIAAYLFF